MFGEVLKKLIWWYVFLNLLRSTFELNFNSYEILTKPKAERFTWNQLLKKEQDIKHRERFLFKLFALVFLQIIICILIYSRIKNNTTHTKYNIIPVHDAPYKMSQPPNKHKMIKTMMCNITSVSYAASEPKFLRKLKHICEEKVDWWLTTGQL